MADVKISALPLASTPLAGTEVLPIVQSATTDQVSVANLTAGRAVSAASLTLTTTPLAAGSGGTGLTSLGTGVATALGNAVNGASGLCVQDASGNLGLGVTPSAWGAGYKALDLNTYGSIQGTTGGLNVTGNAFHNGSNWAYKLNGAATLYATFGGQHTWWNAPSGTANAAISFTQAMTLDASGNLGIGQTTPSGRLDLTGTNSRIRFDVANSYAYQVANNPAGSAYANYVYDGASHQWQVSSAERARIDSSGNLLVGTTSTSGRTTITPANSTTPALSLDGSTYKVTVANNANATAFNTTNMDGALIYIRDSTLTGNAAIAMVNNAAIVILGQSSAGYYVSSTTPSVGTVGIAWGGSNYRIYNAQGNQIIFQVSTIRLA